VRADVLDFLLEAAGERVLGEGEELVAEEGVVVGDVKNLSLPLLGRRDGSLEWETHVEDLAVVCHVRVVAVRPPLAGERAV